MSLKLQKTLELLPKNNYNISKSFKEAGYSDSTSKAGTQYKTLRDYTKRKDYFNEETVKRDIKKVKKLVLKAKDYTNFLRATELESKILGLQIDKSEIKSKVSIEDIEKQHNNLYHRFGLIQPSDT